MTAKKETGIVLKNLRIPDGGETTSMSIEDDALRIYAPTELGQRAAKMWLDEWGCRLLADE
jgi:hypothetical protein